MPKKIIKKAKSITQTKTKKVVKTTHKTIMSRAAFRRFHMPSKNKQAFCIATNGRKIRHGVSKSELEWLNRLGVPEKSKVIILFGKTYVVDGFDPKTNTCYEYNGLRFHGSHKIFPKNRDVKDPWLGKTPNELYYGTLQRYALFKSVGWRVFFVWEDDYKSGKSLGRFYRGAGDNLY